MKDSRGHSLKEVRISGLLILQPHKYPLYRVLFVLETAWALGFNLFVVVLLPGF